MAVQVETLEKLERRITLLLTADTISGEVETRLKKLSRTVKADGFRPGKVPMSVVSQRYGYQVQYEVVNDRVGQSFNNAVNEAKLRVAGAPKITQKEESPQGQMAFDATFEVYPEVTIGDLSTAEVERICTEVTEAAIDRTVEILRKQRRTFGLRAQAEAAVESDRVTIDFEGKIDGEPFAGGKAEAFQFVIGEGQMLAQFDEAVRGMKVGESKTFPLQFPADYHGKDVVGKEAKVCPEQIGATSINRASIGLTTMVIVTEVTVHCPASGVKVYVEVVVLSTTGDQVPVTPLLEVVGKEDKSSPEQIGATCVNRASIGLTIIVIVAVFTVHCPASGVKV